MGEGTAVRHGRPWLLEAAAGRIQRVWSAATMWCARHPVPLLVGFAVLTRLMFGLSASLAAGAMSESPPGTWSRGPAWVQPFIRWDSGYYLDIAVHGYALKPDLWAFHPGYPFLIKGLWALMPFATPEVHAFVLSNVAFLLAVPAFYMLTAELFGRRLAGASTLILCVFPGGFFFGAVYPESLFVLALVLFFASLLRGRWLVAGLLVSVAAALRPQGLFLMPILGVALVRSTRVGDAPWHRWLAVPLAGAFPVAHSLFALSQTGDALMWLHARERFWPGVGLSERLESAGSLVNVPGNYGQPLLGFLLLAGAAAFAAWDLRNRRHTAAWPAWAFVWIILAVTLVYSPVDSLLRFSASAPPVIWMLGRTIERPMTYAAVAVSSAITGCVVAALFATWHYAV